MTAEDHKLAVFDFVLVHVKTAGRRPGCALAVFIKDAAVAWTHEQARFLEPSDGTTQMRAINGEDLELVSLDVPNPAWDLAGLSIPGLRERILVGGQSRLVFGEAGDWAEVDPRAIVLLAE